MTLKRSNQVLRLLKLWFLLAIFIFGIFIIIFPRRSKAPIGDIIWDPAHEDNYRISDRENTYNITYVVIHIGEGSYDAIKWTFKDPDEGVSTHYVISKEGEITQMVHDKDVAFHAGNWEYNKHSIGIEHEGFSDDPDALTEAMYRASADLVRDLAEKYDIRIIHPTGIAPVDADTSSGIIGHNQVPDPNDPSKGGGDGWHHDPGKYWDWRYYINLIRNPNIITNSEKQEKILNWVNEHRNDGGNDWPTEVILGMIAIEGGIGAFHTFGFPDGYNNYKLGPWTEPNNTEQHSGYVSFSDGIMGVTPASRHNGKSGYGYRETYYYLGRKFGGYFNLEIGYEAGIDDGIAYLDYNYGVEWGRGYINAIIHYDTGHYTVYKYKNGKGNKNYLGDLAEALRTTIPEIYGISNDLWVDALEAGQQIVDEILDGLPEGKNVNFYRDYQDELDKKLRSIILFDDTHDTDNDELSGNYYKLKTAIEDKGYRIVESNTDPLTFNTLKPYGILILPDLEIDLSPAEFRGITKFLNRGGRILIIGEWGLAHLPLAVSKISAIMDIYFRQTIVNDPDNYFKQVNYTIIHNIDHSLDIGRGINEFAMYRGSSLHLESNRFAKAIARGDENTYLESTREPPIPPNLLPYGTDIITLAYSKFPVSGGEARLVCIGESDLWKTQTDWEWIDYDPIENYDNKKLLVNIIDWLADPLPPPPTPPIGFGIISQGEVVTKTLKIVEGAPELIVELNWLGSDLDLGVQDPLGRYLGYDPFSNVIRFEIPEAEYSYYNDASEYVKIPNPVPGEWIINVYGREITEEYEPYRIYIPDTFPPAAINDLITLYHTLDSITLSWTAPGDDHNLGKAYSYDVRYSKEPITEENWDEAIQCEGEPIPQVAGTKENYIISGLTQGTSYYFAIKTRDDEDNLSDLSNIPKGATWNYMFDDCERNTKLYINTYEKTFQFITPEKDYNIKVANFMCESSKRILVFHKDEELILIAYVLDKNNDYCKAFGFDLQTCELYTLIDKPGDELY